MSDELRMPLPLTAEEAFRCASFGVEHVPVHVPVRFDRDCPRTMVFFEHRDRPIVFNSAVWGRYFPRDADDVVEQLLTDELIAWMRDKPKTFAPANPYWRKPEGAVRRWFRQMRAADFERAVDTLAGYLRKSTKGYEATNLRLWWKDPDSWDWSLFETQKVIDRETAAHYLSPDEGAIYFVLGGRVVGRIEHLDWSGTDRRDMTHSDDPHFHARVTDIKAPDGY